MQCNFAFDDATYLAVDIHIYLHNLLYPWVQQNYFLTHT